MFEPASDSFMGAYVTLDEYSQVAAGMPLQEAADNYRRETLIKALVVLSRLSDDPVQLAQLTTAFAASLPAEYGERFRQVMRVPTGGQGRRLLAPHPLLIGMRWLLGHPALSEPIADHLEVHQAIMFVHLIGSRLESFDRIHEADDMAVERKRMAVVLMNLGTLSDRQDVYAAIDRTLRIWRSHGDLTMAKLGRPASELYKEATGIEVEDMLAVSSALISKTMEWTPDKPLLINPLLVNTVPATLRDPALRLLSRSLSESLEKLGDPKSQFDVLALEQRPVLALPDGLLVCDEVMLWRRCTSGLFFDVHDWLKAHSEDDAAAFRTAYADIVEAVVEDSFRSIAPRDLSDGTAFYTEHDLASAYRRGSRCDAVVDLGESMLLVEVVSGRLSIETRIDIDLDKLEDDLKRLVWDKCRQLNSAAHNILNDEQRLTQKPARPSPPRLIPIEVVGGGIPFNPLVYDYIRTGLDERGYFQDPRMDPVCVIDMEDVDELEGMSEHGYSVPDVLRQWQSSPLRDVPLHNYLLSRGITARIGARLACAQFSIRHSRTSGNASDYLVTTEDLPCLVEAITART
jgi:hypothetical protein